MWPVLNKKPNTVEFKSGIVIIRKDNVLVKYVRNHDMYILNTNINKVSISNFMNVYNDSIYLRHLRLGHISKNKMIIMYKSRLIPHINLENFTIYEPCVKEKLSSKSFTKSWKSINLLKIIHYYIFESLKTKTHRGLKYFIIFTDDYPRYGHTYLLTQTQVWDNW